MKRERVDQEVLDAVAESRAYERLRLTRRRGFVNVALGLFLLGTFVGGLGIFTRHYTDADALDVRPNVAGLALSLVGAAGGLYARVKWNRWPGLFDVQGRSWTDSMKDWRPKKEEWLSVALILLVVLFELVLIETRPRNVFGLEFAARFTGIALGLLWAAVFQFAGSRSGDSGTYWIGWASVPFVLALGLSPVNRYGGPFGAFWMVLPSAVLLVGLGFARLLKPRRWFYR